MAATVIIEGDSDIATRDRVFDCPYCGEKFIGHLTDTGFELATPAEMNDLGITAKTWYKPGDKFDPTGLEIAALWNNGAMTDVALTDCTLSPDTDTALALTDKKVTVTHTASGETVYVPIRVTNSQIRKPIPVKTSFVYNEGKSIYIQVSGFDSSTMSRSNYYKNHAGSYTATYTPKTGYCWEDGTTDAVSIPWTIDKAVPTATLPSEITLAVGETKIYPTKPPDLELIEAESSDTGICTVASALEGDAFEVTGVAVGTATVTVTMPETQDYYASDEHPTIAVTVTAE